MLERPLVAALLLALAGASGCDEPPRPGASPPAPPESAPEPPPLPATRRLVNEPPLEPGPPDGWPEGFVYLPGGRPQPAVPGPAAIRTFTIVYPAMAPDVLADRLGLELEGAGWSVEAEPPSPRGTQRMTATREGRSVRASVLRGPNGQGSALLVMTM